MDCNLQNINVTYGETYRPQFHFSASKGWINDPNGPIWYRGEYHLFYQYCPDSLVWDGATLGWGHAVSNDLVNWKHLPMALFPDELGSIFSGTVVADEKNTSGLFGNTGGLVAIFTHHTADGREYESLAYSEDDGRTWKKYAGNPVLTGENTVDWKDFRDPKVFWHEPSGHWIMALGGGRYRIYHSQNLREWELCSDMAVFEEFPDLFLLDGKWILNVNGFHYYIGTFDGCRFRSEQPCIQGDFGNSWQACYTFENMPDGRTVWIAWMRDAGKGPTFPWRGNMSVPRELYLEKHGDQEIILQRPIRELETLRIPLFEAENLLLSECDLSEIHGQCLDIEIEMEEDDEKPFGLCLLEKGNARTEVGCRPQENMIYVDTLHTTACAYEGNTRTFSGRLNGVSEPVCMLSQVFYAYRPAGEYLRIRVLVDHSTLEVFFGDGEQVCTVNIYPDQDADGLHLFGEASLKVKKIGVYHMKGIWEEKTD